MNVLLLLVRVRRVPAASLQVSFWRLSLGPLKSPTKQSQRLNKQDSLGLMIKVTLCCFPLAF